MKTLYKLKKYFLRYKKKLLLGVLFIIISNAGSIYVPIVIKDAMNDLQLSVEYNNLMEYAALIIGAALIAGVFRFLIRETIIVVSREIEYDLRQDFYEHIQTLPMSYFHNTNTGDIMARATNDIHAVRMFVGPAVMYSIDTTIRMVIVLTIMFSISFPVTIYSLIPLPILSVLVYFISRKIHARYMQIQAKFAELTTKAQENFSGIRVIKSYVCEDREIEDFERLSNEYLDRNMRLVKLQAMFHPSLFLIMGISITIAIWLGGMQAIEGTLLIGDITAIVIYLGMLIWPVIALGWVINIIQQGAVGMERLLKIWNMKPEEKIFDNSRDYEIREGKIEFKNVSFRYAEDLPYVLKDVSFTIEPGSTAAIMGFTGSGKTTIFNLLTRLYDIKEGEILIDGIDIRNYPPGKLRRFIGLVQQEAFLFSDSIEKNLVYGIEGVDLDKMKETAGIAQFDRDAADFPKQYKTLIGERGITMSGGQKQRAALTRALMVDPVILLLDDSFSAVDTNTEEEILKGLREYMKNRTSVLVSHRVSTVKDADKIIVIDEGKLSEEGTHEELIVNAGIYADIYYKQLLEKEIEEYQ